MEETGQQERGHFCPPRGPMRGGDGAMESAKAPVSMRAPRAIRQAAAGTCASGVPTFTRIYKEPVFLFFSVALGEAL